MKKQMFLGASHLVFQRARELRDQMTHAEMILWGHLKQRPHGHKFRRQHPISCYIADFYCHSLKLIIEVDGSVHANSENGHHDMERQNHLQSMGIFFLRFTNEQVEKNLETVIREIEAHLRSKH